MSGVPCPSCKSPIKLTLDFIIKNPVSQCPHCGVIMKFNENQELFDEYRQVMKDIEYIKKQHKGVTFGNQK